MDKQVRRVCVRELLSNANEALQTQRDAPQKLVDPKSAYYRIPFCELQMNPTTFRAEGGLSGWNASPEDPRFNSPNHGKPRMVLQS